MKSVIKIGSRESHLAVIQAELVKNAIERTHTDIQAEIVTMKTTGDKVLDKSLELIGGKGLFTKELERALLQGEIDICVHSLKDMPMEIAGELPVVAYSEREDARDVLIYKPGNSGFPAGGIVGTSSRRRSLQMQKIYKDCTFRGIRGNVQTRLKKLAKENYDGTVLAAAGLKRLGMWNLCGRVFDVEEMVPAAGQGILAIQGRKGEDYSWLKDISSERSRIEAAAERAFVAALDGGCTSPVAAHAVKKGSELKLTGLYYREADGAYWTETRTGDIRKAERLGESLAEEMKRRWENE